MKATDTFRTPPYCHTCAQAVAYKWRHLFGDADDVVSESARYSGGRAPDGYCGALYTAMRACPDHREDLLRDFVAICGGFRCLEIKREGKTPCIKCVDTADMLVSKYTGSDL